ncbi:MAG: hypothetical protein ACOYEA_02330 [Fermentimonas sp.]|jgi:hypothetical protein
MADNILGKIDNDDSGKKNMHILALFGERRSGEGVAKIVSKYLFPKSAKASANFVQVLNNNNDEKIDNNVIIDAFRGDGQNEGEEQSDNDNVTIRFFSISHDYLLNEIVKIDEDRKNDMIVIGLSGERLLNSTIRQYANLKTNPINTKKNILSLLSQDESQIISDLTYIVENNISNYCVVIDRGLSNVKNVFIPIIRKDDAESLRFAYNRLSNKENVQLMIWDAIGAITNDQNTSKSYQSLKKFGERVDIWDDDNKISDDYIKRQDLMIISVESLKKLLTTQLDWLDDMPSLLIYELQQNV